MTFTPDTTFMIYSPEEESPNTYLSIKILGIGLNFSLPGWVLPPIIEQQEYMPILGEEPRKYKAIIRRQYGVSYAWNEHYLSLYYGMCDDSGDLCSKERYKHKGFFLPWLEKRFTERRLYTPCNRLFAVIPGNSAWEDESELIKRCPVVSFKIKDFDGEIVSASARWQELEWHHGTGWFRWLSIFIKPLVRRSVEVVYDKEVGYGKGGWKGGTLGHGVEVKEGDDIESALCRYYESPVFPDHKGIDFLEMEGV